MQNDIQINHTSEITHSRSELPVWNILAPDIRAKELHRPPEKWKISATNNDNNIYIVGVPWNVEWELASQTQHFGKYIS